MEEQELHQMIDEEMKKEDQREATSAKAKEEGEKSQVDQRAHGRATHFEDESGSILNKELMNWKEFLRKQDKDDEIAEVRLNGVEHAGVGKWKQAEGGLDEQDQGPELHWLRQAIAQYHYYQAVSRSQSDRRGSFEC